MESPVLTKRPPHEWDNQPMTWNRFIALRKWAQSLADNEGFPVYLVGSVLEKEVPRDFDVSVIMPEVEYIRRYGEWPDTCEERDKYMQEVHKKNIRHYFEGRTALGERVPFDLKFCPDSWFRDKDKLLLARPEAIESTESAKAVKGLKGNHQ